MLANFLRQAEADRPVYLPDVRAAFQAAGTRPFHLHVTLYDGTVRVFPLDLPAAVGEAEAAFLAEYVHATLYNILSTLGAVEIRVYLHPGDTALAALARDLDRVFQTDVPKARRSGYGKCLNVNERILAALSGGARFAFTVADVAGEPAPAPAPAAPAGAPVFAALPARTRGRLLLGMDIGGTDIKLAVSWDGRLALCKEFDWYPAGFARAEQLIDPILLLVRLLRAAGSLCAAGLEDRLDHAALGKHATLEEMVRGAAAMERAAGARLRGFDAIGLCFPDVVVDNRIVGGETFKTRGMRDNPALDYEAQFAKITALNDALAAYTVPGGAVMNTNDGPMAAFTAAVEQAAAGGDISRGLFAHTLGTELGTGWVRPDGSIPSIPLEVYNCIIDLGSYPQRRFDQGDVRSVNNFNTLLPGTLQKYASQSGVFRLAAKYLPDRDPAVFSEALDRGLLRWEGERLIVPTAPEDLRKPCLEFFMDQAGRSDSGPCAEIFREIGEYLAVTWQETQYILEDEAADRTLFGRLVKHPSCFRLMCEGAARRAPSLRQYAADGALANTPLMRQLDAMPAYTVAQFAQAVGAIHYACLPLA